MAQEKFDFISQIMENKVSLNIEKEIEQKQSLQVTEEYEIIHASNQIKTLRKIIDLKNILTRQLPKMPKQYIVKLLFDNYHESIAITNNKGNIIGGVCFRQFTQRRFTEVVFLAITESEQIKGYGSKLMNFLKMQMQKRGIQYLITFADNLAISFFRKQGFTSKRLMQPKCWKGFIKDYEGGTIMECPIHHNLDYLKIRDVLKRRKLQLINHIKSLCLNEYIYNTLQVDEKDSFIRINDEGKQQYFKINPFNIPGVRQSGWTWQGHDKLSRDKPMSMILQFQHIIDLMRRHASIWPFRTIQYQQLPQYHDIISKPMDLSTLELNLHNNFYHNSKQFISDVLLIFKNCKDYNNSEESVYYKCASQVQSFIKPHLERLKHGNQQLESSLQKLLSREFKLNQVPHHRKKIRKNEKKKKIEEKIFF